MGENYMRAYYCHYRHQIRLERPFPKTEPTQNQSFNPCLIVTYIHTYIHGIVHTVNSEHIHVSLIITTSEYQGCFCTYTANLIIIFSFLYSTLFIEKIEAKASRVWSPWETFFRSQDSFSLPPLPLLFPFVPNLLAPVNPAADHHLRSVTSSGRSQPVSSRGSPPVSSSSRCIPVPHSSRVRVPRNNQTEGNRRDRKPPEKSNGKSDRFKTHPVLTVNQPGQVSLLEFFSIRRVGSSATFCLMMVVHRSSAGY
jgi:hypothetical protein